MLNPSASCLFCGGALSTPLFQHVRDALGVSSRTWTFYRCDVCGSATLSPLPAPHELRAAYPPHYAVDQAPRHHPLRRLLYRLEMGLFYHPIYRHSVRTVNRVTGLQTGRLLDVGGGSGHRTLFFQQAGFDCIVLDFDERALQVARHQFGLRTLCGRLEDMELPPGSFDVITFYTVIEHLPDPQVTLRHAYRLLRPGGWVVAMVPVITRGQARWLGARWSQVTEAPRHVGLPTPEGMKRLFVACGFEPRGWTGPHPLDEAGILALSLLPTARTPAVCSGNSIARLLALRVGGALLMLLALPVAWTLIRLHQPGLGIFFAQKPI